MKVYIFVIARNTWNSDRQNAQQRGLTQLNAYDLLYRYYPNQNLVICLVPEGFDGDPQWICNQLTNQIKINNLSLDYFKVIYSENHLPGDNWRNINPTTKPPQDIGWYREEIIKGNISSLNSLDPLIIIFTLRYSEVDYPEWHKAINSDKATFYDNNLKPIPINNADKEKIRIAEFIVDNDYTVLFVKENDYGADKGGINNLLLQILGRWGKSFPKEDIYVAVHALSDYAKVKDVDGFKNEFKDKVNYICDFHHTDDPLYIQFCGEEGALIKFLNAMNSNNFNDAKVLCDKLIELIKKMSGKDIRDISFLKHQIVNILEPLRIDIDGLMDKNFEDEYWEKVSNYWRNGNLERIFEDINDIIKKSLEQKVLGQDVKSFVDLLSKKIAELKKLYKVAKLLTALETGDKKTVQNICKLYGNVYKIWMDELIDEFEKMKSNL
jgi:hypothetical protein